MVNFGLIFNLGYQQKQKLMWKNRSMISLDIAHIQQQSTRVTDLSSNLDNDLSFQKNDITSVALLYAVTYDLLCWISMFTGLTSF